jgi:hypothetical protein
MVILLPSPVLTAALADEHTNTVTEYDSGQESTIPECADIPIDIVNRLLHSKTRLRRATAGAKEGDGNDM